MSAGLLLQGDDGEELRASGARSAGIPILLTVSVSECGGGTVTKTEVLVLMSAGTVLIAELFLARRLTGNGGSRGVSSDAMIAAAVGAYPVQILDYPTDLSDLGRCCEAVNRAPDELKLKLLPILSAFIAGFLVDGKGTPIEEPRP